MAYHSHSRNASRRQPRRGRRQTQKSWISPVLWGLGGLAATAVLTGLGYMVWQDLQTTKPDKFACYPHNGSQAETVVFVDSSVPGFDPVQSRDAINLFTKLYFHELSFNERFSMITTQESRIGSIPAPVITLCGPAKSSTDLESVGAANATQAFITRQVQRVFDKHLNPILETVFTTNPSDGDNQTRESPILEQIQSLSRDQGFARKNGPRRLVIVSDMLQNTEEAQFCQSKGHLPTFAKFKDRAYFQNKIRPNSLKGVEVRIYMLIRGILGTKPFAHCTEGELHQFWKDYFKDAGATNVRFTRLRQGGASQ